MKHSVHLLIIVLVTILAACTTKTDVPQIIDDAEHYAAAGKYADAIAVCDRLVTTADSSMLTATQLCRLGVLYAIAADNDVDNATNTARAMHSFVKAKNINADAVTAFVDGLSIEQLSAVRTVLQLLRYQHDDLSDFEDVEDIEEYAAQIGGEENLDSIFNHEQ